MSISSKTGRVFHVPTDEEDVAIRAGIAADPDTYEVEDWSRMRPVGRPKSAAPKVAVTVRYSADVLEWFKSKGDGWQTRMDEALKAYVAQQQEKDQQHAA